MKLHRLTELNIDSIEANSIQYTAQGAVGVNLLVYICHRLSDTYERFGTHALGGCSDIVTKPVYQHEIKYSNSRMNPHVLLALSVYDRIRVTKAA